MKVNKRYGNLLRKYEPSYFFFFMSWSKEIERKIIINIINNMIENKIKKWNVNNNSSSSSRRVI